MERKSRTISRITSSGVASDILYCTTDIPLCFASISSIRSSAAFVPVLSYPLITTSKPELSALPAPQQQRSLLHDRLRRCSPSPKRHRLPTAQRQSQSRPALPSASFSSAATKAAAHIVSSCHIRLHRTHPRHRIERLRHERLRGLVGLLKRSNPRSQFLYLAHA